MHKNDYQIKSVLIQGGLVVNAESQAEQDILIRGEKIVEISSHVKIRDPNITKIDAHGMLIFPGGIDPHVHLTYPDSLHSIEHWVDDLTSGSHAALAGGITTMGNISFPELGESPLDTIRRDAFKIEKEAICDIFLHPVIFYPTDIIIHQLLKLANLGHTSIKIFMPSLEFDQQSYAFSKLIKTAGESGILTMMHCEDFSIISMMTHQLTAEGRSSLKYYAESRPVISELVAVQRAIAICENTGSPIYIVHLSSQRALEACIAAKKRSLPIYVETRPIYLHLTQEKYFNPDGAIYVGQPPLRGHQDVKALWYGLKAGSIQTVATDHAPWKREQKLDPSLNVNKLRPGVNNLQVMLPMLYSEGVLKGKISKNKFVELTSTNAAKLFGFYPRKGNIAVGSDADLAIWNPKLHKKIKDEDIFSKAGFSIYQGWEVTGWPITIIRRGEIVYQHGKILAKPGSGQIVFRNKFNF
jgi:dihydropyrimidinase